MQLNPCDEVRSIVITACVRHLDVDIENGDVHSIRNAPCRLHELRIEKTHHNIEDSELHNTEYNNSHYRELLDFPSRRV